MNHKLTRLFPFVFVFVLALDGHAKTPIVTDISQVLQTLEEHYVPSTPKSFKKIPIKKFKRGKYFISFQTSSTAIRMEWDKTAQFIKLNGVKLSKKSILHSKKLAAKVNKIIGHSNRTYSFISLFINRAHAMPANMGNIIALFLKYIMNHMSTMNQYQPPQRAYSEPINYGPESIFSETTNNNANFYSQASIVATESIVPSSQITEHPETRKPTTIVPVTNCPSGYDAMECRVVELTNQHRQRNGKPALAIGEKCTALSQSHANDMSRNGFFSHTSPSNGSFQSRTQRFGLSGAGENIASGQRTPESVMQAWIKSPGHNENLLRTSFTKIGVSRVGNEWVQCFSR